MVKPSSGGWHHPIRQGISLCNANRRKRVVDLPIASEEIAVLKGGFCIRPDRAIDVQALRTSRADISKDADADASEKA